MSAEEEEEREKGSNTFSTHYDLYPAEKPRPA